METLQALYLGLTVFGLGVTLVDLLGFLGHDQGGSHGASSHGAGHAATHVGGHIDDRQDGTDAANAHEAIAGSAVPVDRSGTSDSRSRGSGVAKAVAMLKLGVWFSLGAGPTGLVAGLFGLTAPSGALWALAGGVFVAVIARGLRRVTRQELDSTFRPEDFILEACTITVPVAPGLMGKAEIRKFGTVHEIYVKASDPAQAFARGDEVRIMDYSDDCYVIEPADEQHRAL